MRAAPPNAPGSPLPTSENLETAAPNSQDDGSSIIPGVWRRRTMSILQAEIPRGMSGMTGVAAAQAPTLSEVRQGAYTTEGEERRQQFTTEKTPPDFHKRRATISRGRKESLATKPRLIAEEPVKPSPATNAQDAGTVDEDGSKEIAALERVATEPDQPPEEELKPNALVSHPTVYDLQRTETGTFPNGYKFPPKHTWSEALSIGFRAFLNFTFRSWFGFLIVFYCVQVIGWGGMIFLLLCTAGDPRMCWLERPPGSGNWVKDCSDKHTSKSLWIEIDAQVLTALFCVTAFGLAPWRCRDLWYLMQYRIWHEHFGLRKLAAVHKGWFRLPGSQHLDPVVSGKDLVEGQDDEAIQFLPHPLAKAPPPPLTGVRALPTTVWKMDFVVWMMFGNTIFQVILCGFMWGQNRYVRPAWATALFIVLGMLSGIAAGWIQFAEGKKIKQREGIPLEVPKQDKGLEREEMNKEERKEHESV
ncbi:hypothetical protein BDV96DRAFT_577420 [Lophiotrema nucula]|uniref:Uncharacterized protein n=1 Tax=Lophiotrema nucula TaxID=690887 RepID=A0A6A5Z4R7_9PLEO|nr:hypothetical protein BDV96DRAFT_577420 [Lophiotrema nucula]